LRKVVTLKPKTRRPSHLEHRPGQARGLGAHPGVGDDGELGAAKAGLTLGVERLGAAGELVSGLDEPGADHLIVAAACDRGVYCLCFAHRMLREGAVEGRP
jgi:hypothetical protein